MLGLPGALGRNKLHIPLSAAAVTAMAVKAYADVAAGASEPPPTTILGAIVALLWFGTAALNAIRGRRERGGPLPNSDHADAVRLASAAVTAVQRLEGRFEQHLEHFGQLATANAQTARDLARLEGVLHERLDVMGEDMAALKGQGKQAYDAIVATNRAVQSLAAVVEARLGKG